MTHPKLVVVLAAMLFVGSALEDLSPGGPLLGAPPVSVPPGFGVVPIPGVGVMLDGVNRSLARRSNGRMRLCA